MGKTIYEIPDMIANVVNAFIENNIPKGDFGHNKEIADSYTMESSYESIERFTMSSWLNVIWKFTKFIN